MAATLTLSGCVSKKKYNLLLDDYNTAKVDLAESKAYNKSLDAMLDEAKANNAQLKDNLAALQGTLSQSIQQNTQGNVNISKLVDEINASNKYIKELIAAKSKSDSLNMVLTNNLTRSLNRDELKDVDVKVLKGVVYISLADNMLFRTGSYAISDRAMETLGKIAKIIKDYKDYDVMVEGNTDNRGSREYNLALGQKRSEAVKQRLQLLGVPASRIEAVSFGREKPRALGDTEEAWAQNRRADIVYR